MSAIAQPPFLVVMTISIEACYRQLDEKKEGPLMAQPDTGLAPTCAVAVDLVVLTVRDDTLQALAIRRKLPPYRGRLALPGGFVGPQETLDAAARRELAEETGLAALVLTAPGRPPHKEDGPAHLEQLATYGDPGRDPRGRVVTVAYLALAPDLPAPAAGSDAARADWMPLATLLSDRARLAFDHDRILRDGVERARAKLEYTNLATAFCPPEFTVAELRRVYDVVWDAELDPRNFHRKATGSTGFIQPADGHTTRGGGRPAQLYRTGPATLLSPPILRPTAGAT
jgi:8-oxo-dGTP diphosphatase